MSDDEYAEYLAGEVWTLIGPSGGILQIDGLEGDDYGVIFEIAPGQLEDYHHFKVSYDLGRNLPTGFSGWPRIDRATFRISTWVLSIPDFEITITFPIPDDIDLEDGWLLAAFSLDETWRFLLPDYIEKDSMTVVTTFRSVWARGRVNVRTVDKKYLEAALNEQMGENQADMIAAMINETRDEITELWEEITNGSSTVCEALHVLHDGYLEDSRQSARTSLMAYNIPGWCGICDPLDPGFIADTVEFISKYLWLKFTEMIVGGISTSFALELGWRIYIISLYSELHNYDCNKLCIQGAIDDGGLEPAFWVDCGLYHIMNGGQALIRQYCSD